jgi:hypothetical protein
VARADDGSIAWLVEESDDQWVRVLEPPTAEEIRVAELKNVHDPKWSHSQWRREKATRLVSELVELARLRSARVLELGAVTDDFRYALEDAGLEHHGIGLGQVRQTRELLERRPTRYAAVTFWDSLAGDADPPGLLAAAHDCLLPHGMVAIKTPNIRCPEARLFGPHFHCLRREHLTYFTPESLLSTLRQAGFEPVSLVSVSHLLVGFIGAGGCAELAGQMRGSDLIGYFRRVD